MNRRSIILEGKTTSISLETIFWDELDRRAEDEGLSWANYFRKLLSEIGEPQNRAAAIKEKLLLKLRDEKTQLVSQNSITSRWSVVASNEERVTILEGVRLLVGRSENNDIVLLDNEISRAHLMLVFDGKFWWAIDLDTKNHSRIGRKKIKAERITHGVEIKIGNSSISLLG